MVYFNEDSTLPVAGVSKISALKRTTEVVEHRAGGDSNTVYKSPGQTKFEPITLERGVTQDEEFKKWANKVWSRNSENGQLVSLKDFRKNIRIVLQNEAGQAVLGYNISRCWVSEYQALPELDASANSIAIQMLVIQHEGWEQDEDIKEQDEPSFE